MVEKDNLLVKLKYTQNKSTGYFLLSYVCSEEGVGHKVNKPIPNLKKISRIFTIDVNPVNEQECMFEQGMYLYVFNCLCFVNET